MSITRAFEVCIKNWRLFMAIVLPIGVITVGMSHLANLWVNRYYPYPIEILGTFNSKESISMITRYVVSPLWIGALFYTLYKLDNEQTTSYGQAIAFGFSKWSKNLTIGLIGILLQFLPRGLYEYANLPGALIYVLYFLALLLIVRYFFVMPVLTLENHSYVHSVQRSARLSDGKRVAIFFDLVALYMVISVFTIMLSLSLSLLPITIPLPLDIHYVFIEGIVKPIIDLFIFVWIYVFYREQQSLQPL